MGLHPKGLGQRTKNVLPFEKAVGEVVETGVFLDADERGQVIGERALDRIGADPTAVDASRRRNHLLRAGIDAVLIGENVDSESLDEAPTPTYNAPSSVRMKGFGAGLYVLVAIVLAGCGGDTTTTFVLESGSPSASAKAGASPLTSASATPAGSSLPVTAATPIPEGLKIIIDSPDSNTAISSPLLVSGTASVDKGTVVAVVLDAGGNELGRATTTASAVKPDFGHFDVSVTFSGATSGAKGRIRVFGVSPRDGTTPTNFYYIDVRFA